MRLTLLLLALVCCAVVAYFGLLAVPDATIHLERSRQLVNERMGDPVALAEARESIDRAIAIAQRTGRRDLLHDALMQRGLILQRLGSFAPALRDFQTVIELDPSSDIQTVFEIVDTLISAGRSFEKLESFDKAFEFLDAASNSLTSPVARQNGRLAAARGQCYATRAGARIDLQRSVLLNLHDGRDPSLRIHALEAFCAHLEEGPRAEALREDLLRQLSAADDLRRKEILGAAEAARDDLRSALRFLEESVEESPRPQSVARLLEISCAAEHWERVLDLGGIFDSALGAKVIGIAVDHPVYAIVPYSRAKAQRMTGRPAAALGTLDAYLERNPRIIEHDIFLEHLDLMLSNGQGERALGLVEAVKTIPTQLENPRVARALTYYEGLALAATGELSAARQSLKLFVDQSTARSEPVRLPLALERLAALCEELGEPEEANRYQERLLPLLENPARVHAELARRAFERQLDFQEASRLLLQAMQEEPTLALEAMPLWRRIGGAFLERAGVAVEAAASQAIKSSSLRAYLFDPSVLFLVAEHLVESGRALESLPILLNLSQLAPRFAPAKRLRARASAALGHYPRAVKAYQEYLDLVPLDRTAWVDLEELLEHSSESVSRAEQRSIRFRALRAILPERGAVELARLLLKDGEVARALELASSPRLSSAHRNELASILARAIADVRPEEALKLLDALPEEAPDLASSRLLALRLALRLTDHPEGHPDRIAERVRILRSMPDLPLDDLRACIWALIEKGRGEEAADLLHLVPAESPSRDATWYRQLGLALALRKDWHRSEVAFDRALAYGDEAGLQAACDLFLILYAQQRFSEALELVDLLRQLPVSSTGRFPRLLAVLATLAGDPGDAVEVLQDSTLGDHPFAPTAAVVRRLVETEGDEFPELEPASVSILPHPSLAWIEEMSRPELLLYLEAVVLREAGHRATRLRAIVEHLAQRHPRGASLHLMLAEALHDLGQHASVVPLVQLALSISPDLGPALDLLNRTVARVGDAQQRWQIAAQRLRYLGGKPDAPESALFELGDEILDLDRPNEVLTALYEMGPRAESSALLLALSARAWCAAASPERAQRQVREIWLRFDASGAKTDTAHVVGREYLRALRLSQPVGWAELMTAAPRLAPLFPEDVLIQILAAEVELRGIETESEFEGASLRVAERRRECIARTLQALLESDESLFDDGATSAGVLLRALKTGDTALYERVLWSELTKRPERSELWLWHADALLALGQEPDVVEEYRLLGSFETNAEALVGRARHLARVSWDEAEAARILEVLGELQREANDEQRVAMLASRAWLLIGMGRAEEALDLLKASAVDPKSTLTLREAWIRAAFLSGRPEGIREAAELAFEPNGEVAMGSSLVARSLQHVAAALPR